MPPNSTTTQSLSSDCIMISPDFMAGRGALPGAGFSISSYRHFIILYLCGGFKA
jgi:hypothetical protein